MLAAREQPRNREAGALLIIAITAGLFHLAGVIEFGRGFEMVKIARNLAQRGVFADPFDAGQTGFTAVNPPVYPLLLAFFFKLLRNESVIACTATIANIAANALSAVLLPRVSLVLFGERFPGIVAAIGCLAAMRLMPAWDTSYTIAGTLLFCLFSASTMQRAPGMAGRGALAGIGAGTLALMNPASVLIVLPWAAWLAVRRRAWAWCCAMLTGFALVVSIWVLRNDVRLGALVLRTNFGMTIYASNNDCAAASLRDSESDGCYERHHPNTSGQEAQLVRELGEVGYDRRRTAETMHWITSHPRRFSRLTWERFRDFWFPGPLRSPSNTVIWLMTAFSVPGLILLIRRSEPCMIFLSAVLIAYPLMYYIVVSDVRYRYPILWVSALAAGYFASACRCWLQTHRPALLM